MNLCDHFLPVIRRDLPEVFYRNSFTRCSLIYFQHGPNIHEKRYKINEAIMIRRCACDACSAWGNETLLQDGYCLFCNQNCYPLQALSPRITRLCRTPEERRTIHTQDPLTQADILWRVKTEMRQTLARHGPPLLEQAAKKWIRQLTRKIFSPR